MLAKPQIRVILDLFCFSLPSTSDKYHTLGVGVIKPKYPVMKCQRKCRGEVQCWGGVCAGVQLGSRGAQHVCGPVGTGLLHLTWLLCKFRLPLLISPHRDRPMGCYQTPDGLEEVTFVPCCSRLAGEHSIQHLVVAKCQVVDFVESLPGTEVE